MSNVAHFIESARYLLYTFVLVITSIETLTQWRRAFTARQSWTQVLCAVKLNGLLIATIVMFLFACHFRPHDRFIPVAEIISLSMYLLPEIFLKLQAKRAARNAILQSKQTGQKTMVAENTPAQNSEPMASLRRSEDTSVQQHVQQGR